MNRFEHVFSEPFSMTRGYAISRERFTREEAAAIIADYESECDPLDLQEERVRFGYPPRDVDFDFYGDYRPIWYTGASGRGSKPIWWWEK